MEKVNMEMVISSLLIMGFDKVDSILVIFTVGQLSFDNHKAGLFSFENEEFSKTFDEYIECVNSVYKFKDGYDLDSNVSFDNDKYWPLKNRLHTNEKLLAYLSSLDFTPIIQRKINFIGKNNISKFDYLFSEKEKSIMCLKEYAR